MHHDGKKIEAIRNEVVTSILNISFYLIPIGIIGMVVRATVTGWLMSNTVNLILVSILFMTSVFQRNISTKIKSLVLVYVLIFLGASIFLQNGLLSFGPIYFLTAFGVSMVLLDRFLNYVVFFTIFMITFFTAYFIVSFKILPEYDLAAYMISSKAWVTTIVNILILVSVLYFTLIKYNTALIQSILETSETEKRLLEQSKNAAIGHMLANIAHQWRQPLNNISLIVQHLYFSYDNVKENDIIMHKGFNDISENVKHMIDTMESFRGYLRPNLTHDSFDLLSSLNDALTIIRPAINNNNILLDKNIQLENIYLKGMRNRLTQVILVLLNNSIDALKEINTNVKEINIVAYLDHNNIFIKIEDNGIGIGLSELNQIFEPYYSTKKDDLGTGLGLYIAKDIIENDFHGSIKAENNEIGAAFEIRLPLNNSIGL